jgi:dTDP-4-dehydrorhamnose reductase
MITLVGHGYVGKYIAAELDTQGVPYRWVDHDYIADIGLPADTDFVINAAGFTGVPNVDACENRRDDCFNGNVMFPLYLEEIAGHVNVPVLHISSGCVYTGYPAGGFTETDPTNLGFDNGSFYSATKAAFQELWVPHNDRSYLFRIRMPFGPDVSDKNLLTKLQKYKKLIDYKNSVSYLPDVAKAAVHFALHRPAPGIYNAVNPVPLTTHDITKFMNLYADWMDEAEFKSITVAPRSNCTLNTDKMQAVFKFQDSTRALTDCLNQLHEQYPNY